MGVALRPSRTQVPLGGPSEGASALAPSCGLGGWGPKGGAGRGGSCSLDSGFVVPRDLPTSMSDLTGVSGGAWVAS